MDKINILIEEEKIKNRIREIAEEIEKDFSGEEIVLICILKGATIFTVDLAKKIQKNDVILDFIRVSSYGNSKETTGKIDFKLDINTDIKNKNVIIVEDIIDTGYTLKYLKEHILKKEPKELKICALLDKREKRIVNVKVDYIGFEIEDKFVLGYGMDYEEKYRNLPYIGYIK